MNYSILLSIIGPVIVSILTVVLLDYIKNKKMRSMKILFHSSFDMKIFELLWLVCSIFVISSLYVSFSFYIESVTIEIYNFFTYRAYISLIFFSILSLYPFRSYILQSIKKDKDNIFILALLLIITLLQALFIVYKIYNLVPYEGYSNALLFSIVNYFLSNFALKFYIGSNNITIIESIRIITKEEEEHIADKIDFQDNYIVFYNKDSNKRTLISIELIKLIEYKYHKK